MSSSGIVREDHFMSVGMFECSGERQGDFVAVRIANFDVFSDLGNVEYSHRDCERTRNCIAEIDQGMDPREEFSPPEAPQ